MRVTHGCYKTKTYHIWEGMKARCLNPNNPNYRKYGGRGIFVCERWLKFENFLDDMGECPAGRSIDRIENDGGYEPGNCRWATNQQQALNNSRNVLWTHAGKTQTIMEWARETGIGFTTLRCRVIRSGWPIEKALTTRTLKANERRSCHAR